MNHRRLRKRLQAPSLKRISGVTVEIWGRCGFQELIIISEDSLGRLKPVLKG